MNLSFLEFCFLFFVGISLNSSLAFSGDDKKELNSVSLVKCSINYVDESNQYKNLEVETEVPIKVQEENGEIKYKFEATKDQFYYLCLAMGKLLERMDIKKVSIKYFILKLPEIEPESKTYLQWVSDFLRSPTVSFREDDSNQVASFTEEVINKLKGVNRITTRVDWNRSTCYLSEKILGQISEDKVDWIEQIRMKLNPDPNLNDDGLANQSLQDFVLDYFNQNELMSYLHVLYNKFLNHGLMVGMNDEHGIRYFKIIPSKTENNRMTVHFFASFGSVRSMADPINLLILDRPVALDLSFDVIATGDSKTPYKYENKRLTLSKEHMHPIEHQIVEILKMELGNPKEFFKGF